MVLAETRLMVLAGTRPMVLAGTRPMVLAGTQVPEPIRVLALSWPATVTSAIEADGSPDPAGAVALVDVTDRATADGADVARDTSGRASGDASASVGNDTGWWIGIEVAAAGPAEAAA
jgi:hypothetical protein